MATPAPKISRFGNMSNEGREWIAKHVHELTSQQMAEQLQTNPERIDKVIASLGIVKDRPNLLWRDRLKTSKAYRHIKMEFTPDELEYFSDKYIQYMQQFKDEVLPTEEQQVINVIRVEIMMHRNLASRLQLTESENRTNDILTAVLDGVNGRAEALTDEDREQMINLQNQLSDIDSAKNVKTKELLDLNKEHSSIMEKLKASRAQRIQNATNEKLTWPEMVKKLMDRDVQEEEARKFELRRIASDRELVRLTKPHKFMDGVVDLPILYSGSVDNLAGAENLVFDEPENEVDNKQQEILEDKQEEE